MVALVLTLGTALHALPARYPLTEHRWDNPEFRERFRGTYAFDSTLSPPITSAEQTLFQELQALLPGRIDEAIRRLSAAITPDSSPALRFILGNFYFEQGRIEQAEAAFKQAIQAFPDFFRAYQNLGFLYVQQERYDTALPFLTKALELKGGNAGLYGLIGFCYLNTDRPTFALDAYRQALLLQPQSTDWRRGKFEALRATGQLEEAVGMLDDLLSENPNQPELRKAQISPLVALERYDDAIVNLEILRRSEALDTPSAQLLGDLYLQAGLAGDALAVYASVSDGEQAAPWGRQLRMARSLLEQGALDEAAAYLEAFEARVQSAEVGPQRAEALELLVLQAQVARLRADTERAVALLEDVVARDPLNGDALMALGRHFRQAGALAQAAFHLEAAARIEVFQVRAWIELARVRVAERDYTAAIRLLQRVQQIDPRPHLEEYLDQLRAVQRQLAES